MYGVPALQPWYVKHWRVIALVVATIVFFMVCMAALSFWKDKQNIQTLVDLAREREQVAAKEVQIRELTESITAKQTEHQAEIAVKDRQIAAIRQEITMLEFSKQEINLSTRLLKTEDALLELFKESYPQVARDRGLGILELDDGGITLPYMVVPAWFAETFVIEHNHLGIANEQLMKHQEQEALYGDIITLNNKVLTLEQEKSTAYQDGYNEALLLYNQVSDKYEACLKEPRIDIPNKYGIAAGLVGGFVACKAVKFELKF